MLPERWFGRARHPIFDRFQTFDGYAEPGFERGFYGVNIRDWLFAGESKGYNTRRPAHVGHPPIDEEYFEWIALLTAIHEASGRFRMAELGAGWGRWTLSAAALCRQRALACELIAVEAEPSHFDWLQMTLRDNDIDPAAHVIVGAAVTPTADGPALLVGPDAPKTIYGCKVVPEVERPQWEQLPEYTCRQVRQISLRELLHDRLPVDLIDIDIQGTELDVLTQAIDVLNVGVKIIHIGTHSSDIEHGLRTLFRRHGWRAAFDYSTQGLRNTRFGPIRFGDGVQVWANPQWPHLHRSLRG